MPGPRDWQDRYYDGETDDIFAVFADEGTPEDDMSLLDTQDWVVYTVSQEEWDWLQDLLDEEPQFLPRLYNLMHPEEGDDAGLE